MPLVISANSTSCSKNLRDPGPQAFGFLTSSRTVYIYIRIPARSPVPTPKWHRGATRPASSPDPCSLEAGSGPRNKPDKPSIRHSSWGPGRSSRRPVGVGDLHRMPVETVRVNFFARVGRIVTDITLSPLPSLADVFRHVAPSPASPFLLNMRDLQTHNRHCAPNNGRQGRGALPPPPRKRKPPCRRGLLSQEPSLGRHCHESLTA